MLNIILLFSASHCSRCFFAVSGTNGILTKNQDVSLSKIHLVQFTWPAREVLLSIALMSWKGIRSGCSECTLRKHWYLDSWTIKFGFVLSASPSSEWMNEESLTLKRQLSNLLTGINWHLTTPLIKTFFLFYSPPMQHHTVLRKTNHSSKVSNVGRFKTLIEDIRYLLIHE